MRERSRETPAQIQDRFNRIFGSLEPDHMSPQQRQQLETIYADPNSPIYNPPTQYDLGGPWPFQ